MNANSRGINLKIQIQMTLNALGRPVDSINLNRKTIAELQEIFRGLYREYQEQRVAN